MTRTSVLLFVLITLGCAAVARAEVRILGNADVSFSQIEPEVSIRLKFLSNRGTETTERLRVLVWASDDRWHHTSDRKVVAVATLPKLKPERTVARLGRRVKVHGREGWYYITLTLQERVFDEEGQARWITHQVIELDDIRYIRTRDRFPF